MIVVWMITVALAFMLETREFAMGVTLGASVLLSSYLFVFRRPL